MLWNYAKTKGLLYLCIYSRQKNIPESSVKCNFCNIFVFAFAYCFMGENTENKCGARKTGKRKRREV